VLKFYYNFRSPMARRVWRYLLEKGIDFEPIVMNLNGDQMQTEYLAMNPFHHVPVIVDDGFRVLESLAILDYLETKYPEPALLPKDARTLATVRMAQMVSTNELLPKVIALIFEDEDSPKLAKAKQHLDTGLTFLDETLGDNLYFGGEKISVADIVVGTDLSLLPKLGLNFDNYPKINAWFERLMQREVWRKTELTMEEYEQFKRVLKILIKRQSR
jgi:glutathione S-transferase